MHVWRDAQSDIAQLEWFWALAESFRAAQITERAERFRMKSVVVLLGLALSAVAAGAQGMRCDMQGYKTADGLKAEVSRDGVTLTWAGENRNELRASFGLREGQPIVQELAARRPGGAWAVLGKDLVPDFQVTTGKRRMSKTEDDILKRLNAETPENQE